MSTARSAVPPAAPARPDLDRYLGDLVAAGAVSGAAALVGSGEEVEWTGAAGLRRLPGLRAGEETRWDLGSLTKPFVATLALALDAAGALPLATRLGEVWPGAHPDLARRPLEDLLRHRAGFLAWVPLYARCRSREEVLALLLGGGVLGARPGTYSDLDFILWGMSAERALGEPLSVLLHSRVLAPLGLDRVEPNPGDRPEVAESWMDGGKEREIAAGQGAEIAAPGPPPPGVVQDGNARFLAGLGSPVSGNAGLFGRAEDVWRLGVEWLEPGRLLHPEAVAAALRGGRAYALCWKRRTLRGSAGRALGPACFGHTGFAGGSLWIDPARRRILVLLGHRRGAAVNLNPWRRQFHAVAYHGQGALAAPDL